MSRLWFPWEAGSRAARQEPDYLRELMWAPDLPGTFVLPGLWKSTLQNMQTDTVCLLTFPKLISFCEFQEKNVFF